MINTAMLARFRQYMEDKNGSLFEDAEAYDLLTQGQEDIVAITKYKLLSSIHFNETVTVGANGEYSIDSLTDTPFNDISGVRIVKIKDGEYAVLLSLKEYLVRKGANESFSLQEPFYYYIGKTLYLAAFEASSTQIDIYGVKVPGIIDASTSSELNTALHDPICRMAASIGWEIAENENRGLLHYNKAVAKLGDLGVHKPLTESNTRLNRFQRSPVETINVEITYDD